MIDDTPCIPGYFDGLISVGDVVYLVGKPAGARGARAAFQQMDKANPGNRPK